MEIVWKQSKFWKYCFCFVRKFSLWTCACACVCGGLCACTHACVCLSNSFIECCWMENQKLWQEEEIWRCKVQSVVDNQHSTITAQPSLASPPARGGTWDRLEAWGMGTTPIEAGIPKMVGTMGLRAAARRLGGPLPLFSLLLDMGFHSHVRPLPTSRRPFCVGLTPTSLSLILILNFILNSLMNSSTW